MCFRSRDPSISREPAVEGPVEGLALKMLHAP
jgi:hypothetical protein